MSASDGEPEGQCVRCGRPTPAGVSLCETDNPGRIGSPSPTQVHGTILAGVVGGFVLFALGARLVVGGGGPFTAAISTGTIRPDGGAEVVVRVANEGASDSSASCRVTRDGVARQEDYSFRTPNITAGGALDLQRILPAPGDLAYDLARVTIVCR